MNKVSISYFHDILSSHKSQKGLETKFETKQLNLGKVDTEQSLKTMRSNGNHRLIPDSGYLVQLYNKSIPWCCKNGEVTL